MEKISRRSFIATSGLGALGIALGSKGAEALTEKTGTRILIGTIQEPCALAEIEKHFQSEIIKNDGQNAWYVDYFTDQPTRYGVKYFSDIRMLSWTNEKIHDLPPGPEGRWDSDDVAEWFHQQEAFLRDERTVTGPPVADLPCRETLFTNVLNFVAGGKNHTVSLAAKRIEIDGKNSPEAWDRYVDYGVRGAMRPFLSTYEKLVSIDIYGERRA